MIVIVMGVTGSGKTTVGTRLAELLNYEFFDADWFHSQANIDKMNYGIPLDDADRLPWLKSLQHAIAQWLDENKNVVLACSGLKAAYRQFLHCDRKQIQLIYLKGNADLIAQRLNKRQNHFMDKALLQSQLDALEEPTVEESIWIEISDSPDAIAQAIKNRLKV